ncbi:MAG TPA: GtrA family protein [Steroidobacteraceae bacterium]|nr:GtrA family protein [Steroidobacteraceae bacterium]
MNFDAAYRVSVFRYLGVGVLNTLVGLGAIYACMYALGLGDVLSNFIGYSLGIILSFILNKYWTFENTQAGGPQFVRFLLVVATAYLLNLAVVEACIHLLGMSRYFAQAAGIPPYTLAGYVGSRYFAFRTG